MGGKILLGPERVRGKGGGHGRGTAGRGQYETREGLSEGVRGEYGGKLESRESMYGRKNWEIYLNVLW